MNYPTMEEVEGANQEQLCRWYRFLPSPGSKGTTREDFEEICNREAQIMTRIFDRWREGGGFTPELNKKIGF